jgi:hypothetical protein
VYKTWIESELVGGLRPVEAPGELWGRVEAGRIAGCRQDCLPHNVAHTGRWVVALVTLVLSVVVWASYPRTLGIRSSQGSLVREWVRVNAGLDVPLRGDPSPVRLVGARVVKGGVEIACRVGNREARLVVSKAASSHGRYTLKCATPEDMKTACLLCHV